MAAKDKTSGMKSAYELALERLAARGIEPPREEALDAATRGEIAAARQKAEARLAELEILHRDRLRKIQDAEARDKEEEEYLLERRRIEEEKERAVARLRQG